MKGSSTTLVADFTGVSATIDQGVGAIDSTVPLAVTPSASTVYTLTVNGSDGSTATAAASIDVYDQNLVVSVTDPTGPGSLADAMATANASGSSVITFALPDPSTIALGATLVSSGTVTIRGPGRTKLAISGADQRRLFFVGGGALTMSGVTLTHGLGAGGNGGNSPGGGGGGGAAGMGGAMFINAGAVTLKDLVLSENVAKGGAGGTASQNGFANGGGGGGFGGAGGGGGGAGQQQNGGDGAFGGGGGGSGGLSAAGIGGFGGGTGRGTTSAPPAMFGGVAVSLSAGGGAGLGGALFLRAGTLVVTNSTFTNNHALAGGAGATAGKAKAGAIFALVPTVTLTGTTYTGSVAADANATSSDNLDVYLTP